MTKIFICDDNFIERKKIESNILSYISTHPNTVINYNIFSSPFELLEETEKSGAPDIVLLDIYMPELLGTDCARYLSRLSEKIDIIFVTTSADFALEAFSLHAFDYIKKPYTQEKFDSSLDRAIKEREKKNWILLSSGGKVHRVALEDIIYIETIDKKRIFALTNGLKLQSWYSVAELEEKILVGKGLIRCGCSYIINLSHAKCFSGNKLVMDNGAIIPIPRRLRPSIKEQYFDFYIGEARCNAGS